MGSALKIAMASLARAGSAQITASARSLAIQACAVVIASIFVFGSIGCAIAALWIFTVPKLGEAGAALVSAGFLLLMGVLVILISQWIVRKERQKTVIPQLPFMPFAEANKLYAKNKGAALMVALVAGMLVAEKRNQP